MLDDVVVGNGNPPPRNTLGEGNPEHSSGNSDGDPETVKLSKNKGNLWKLLPTYIVVIIQDYKTQDKVKARKS